MFRGCNRTPFTMTRPGPAGSPLDRPASGAKAKRLSRSFRLTQHSPAAEVAPPRSRTSDFKTPTRISGSRGLGGPSAESPQNESDLQDIIWDATSPSPRRLGKRGKARPAGVVDISEIVSRIAPKHGRPTVAEPTLQQWIGDSAAIPCTPDVLAPRPKKKSPRANGVEDLLRLAKQFDLNMFHGDEEEVEVVQQQDGVSPPLTRAADGQVGSGRHGEDELDFLFDGPTQRISGSLSQMSGAPHVSSPPASASAGFVDDWDDDDLLNDSLMLEVTQNPQNLDVPKNFPPQSPGREAAKPEKENVRPATIPEATRRCSQVEATRRCSQVEATRRCSQVEGSSDQSRSKSFSVDSQLYRRSSASSASTKTQGFLKVPEAVPTSTPAARDFLEEDLDSFFSDLLWDDPADDDLLCEMCDDVEKQIQIQRAALQPWDRPRDRSQRPVPGRGPAVKGSLRSSQTNVSAGSTGGSSSSTRDRFTFKQPNLVSTVTSAAVAKCSAAEIELKKQQAVARRRRRLQAQSLRAPT